MLERDVAQSITDDIAKVKETAAAEQRRAKAERKAAHEHFVSAFNRLFGELSKSTKVTLIDTNAQFLFKGTRFWVSRDVYYGRDDAGGREPDRDYIQWVLVRQGGGRVNLLYDTDYPRGDFNGYKRIVEGIKQLEKAAVPLRE